MKCPRCRRGTLRWVRVDVDEMKLERDGHLGWGRVPSGDHAWAVPVHTLIPGHIEYGPADRRGTLTEDSRP